MADLDLPTATKIVASSPVWFPPFPPISHLGQFAALLRSLWPIILVMCLAAPTKSPCQVC